MVRRPLLLVACALALSGAPRVSSAGPITTTLTLDPNLRHIPVSGRYGLLSVVETTKDLNGDGDLLDRVVHVYDAQTNTSRNLALATELPPLDMFTRYTPFQVFGAWGAFLVAEAAQGADRNGDGDLLDAVPCVVRLATGARTNLGLASDGFLQLDDGWLAFGVWELANGAGDLNGDGDPFDVVLHVRTLGAGATTTNVAVAIAPLSPFAEWAAFATNGSAFVFPLAEAAHGADINLDGDVFDLIAQMYVPATGVRTNLGLALMWPPYFFPGRTTGSFLPLHVDEFGSAGADRNGDGDVLDIVLAVVDVATGVVINVGRSVDYGAVGDDADTAVYIGGSYVWFETAEAAEGFDLNGDGDAIDRNVRQVYDVGSGALISIGHAMRGADEILTAGATGLAASSEVELGDRNADGDARDFVVTRFDASTGLLVNYGLALSTSPDHRVGAQAVVRVSEADQGGVTRNGDVDALDAVVAYFDTNTGAVVNTGRAAHPTAAVSASLAVVAFLASEADDGGTDFNGDGDTNDLVVQDASVASGAILNTGFAVPVGSYADAADRPMTLAANRIWVIVSEAAQHGMDLNGDGDALDRVLWIYAR